MNNIQNFAKNESNVRRLIRALANDDCEICPAYRFCKQDASRKQPRYEDCSDAFVAWALKEKASLK